MPDDPTITLDLLQTRHRELLAEEARFTALLHRVTGARLDVEVWMGYMKGDVTFTPPEGAS